MEKIVEEIVKKRVEENQKLFTKEELQCIKENNTLIEKIYIIGIIDNYIVRNI